MFPKDNRMHPFHFKCFHFTAHQLRETELITKTTNLKRYFNQSCKEQKPAQTSSGKGAQNHPCPVRRLRPAGPPSEWKGGLGEGPEMKGSSLLLLPGSCTLPPPSLPALVLCILF
jgi:hypothetical protein